MGDLRMINDKIKHKNDYILLVFAFIFTFFATSRSIIPEFSFSVLAILWLLYTFPFYYNKNFMDKNIINFTILIFVFIVFLSGVLHFGEKFSNDNIRNLLGSIVMYWIIIFLVRTYAIYKRMLLMHIVVILPVVLVMAYRSWFHFNSYWLSPYWNNNYALGKNTVGLFLVFCFNYLYSYYHYRRSFISLLGLIVIFSLTLYTVSRGAVISLFFIIILTPIFSKKKKTHIKSILTIILSFVLLIKIFDFNLVYTFMAAKKSGASLQLGSNYDAEDPLFFLGLKGHNLGSGKYKISQRAQHWLTIKEKFPHNPLFGHGSGSFRRNEGTLAHNDYLSIIYEYGIIGLIIFLNICWQHLFGLLKSMKKIPTEYRWISEAQVVQLFILFFTFLTVDVYMNPLTWYIFAGSAVLIKLSKDKKVIL